jgi:hypothetical protein
MHIGAAPFWKKCVEIAYRFIFENTQEKKNFRLFCFSKSGG